MSPPAWGVRRGDPADVAALAHLVAQVLPEAGDEAFLRGLLVRPAAEFWLGGEQGGPPAGFLVAQRVPPELEILWLGVLAEARRAGLGRALLGAAGRDCESIHLEVRAGNRAALAFYRSEGFGERGRRRSYYPGGEDAISLQRPLRDIPRG